jgi:hypothetical protein
MALKQANSVSSTPNSRNFSRPSPTAFVFSWSSTAEDDSTAGENEMRPGDDRWLWLWWVWMKEV